MAETETKAPQPDTGNQGVQLGIGTLIIITIIVTMCSGRSDVEKVRKDTTELKQRLEAMDKKLDTLVSKSDAAASTSVETAAAPADAGGAPSRNP